MGFIKAICIILRLSLASAVDRRSRTRPSWAPKGVLSRATRSPASPWARVPSPLSRCSARRCPLRARAPGPSRSRSARLRDHAQRDRRPPPSPPPPGYAAGPLPTALRQTVGPAPGPTGALPQRHRPADAEAAQSRRTARPPRRSESSCDAITADAGRAAARDGRPLNAPPLTRTAHAVRRRATARRTPDPRHRRPDVGQLERLHPERPRRRAPRSPR